MGSIEIKYGDKTDIHSLEALGESFGGGQPLYRHTINVYEGGGDRYDLCIEFISTSNEVVDTEEKFKAILGTPTEDFTVIYQCTGRYVCDTTFELVPASYIGCQQNEYRIFDDLIMGHSASLFPTDYDLNINDTVTEIGTASVSGGGDCQVVDLGQLDGHGDSDNCAQTVILDLLKPTSVPNGKYLYTYHLLTGAGCDKNEATIAICHKGDEKIECVQITSGAQYRRFWYNFESEETGNECFQPFGGKKKIMHTIHIGDDTNFQCDAVMQIIDESTEPINTWDKFLSKVSTDVKYMCSGIIYKGDVDHTVYMLHVSSSGTGITIGGGEVGSSEYYDISNLYVKELNQVEI